MRRILLWGWCGFENLGDDLLLDTMLQYIKGDVTVPMNKQYGIEGIKEVTRSYPKLVMGALHNDVLIIGPGGLFPFDNKIKTLFYYVVSKMWKILGRKVIFFGIGISERMSNFSTILWRKMAQNADLFIPRSKKVLDRIGLDETETIHSMADTVFASKLKQTKQCMNNDNRIGISIANLKAENVKAFDDAVKIWVEVIRGLLEKGYKVDLIAFTKGNDEKMIDRIMASPKISGGYAQYITKMQPML